MAKQENVCKKYGITREALQAGVDQFCKKSVGKMAGDMQVLLAILDLLTSGDIAPEGTEED